MSEYRSNFSISYIFSPLLSGFDRAARIPSYSEWGTHMDGPGMYHM